MIHIIVVVFNKPAYLELQYNSVKKFVQGKFTFTVYDNSIDSNISAQFISECTRLNIPYVRVPHMNLSDPSQRAGVSLSFAIWETYRQYKDGVLFVLDSDMFLVDNVDPVEILGNDDFVGICQCREHIIYYTNQLAFINLSYDLSKIDFTPGIVENIRGDCGIKLHNYFQKHRGIEGIICSNQVTRDNYRQLFDSRFYDYFESEFKLVDKFFMNLLYPDKCFSEFYLDKKILHLKSGSNWMGFPDDIMEKRDQNLVALFESF